MLSPCLPLEFIRVNEAGSSALKAKSFFICERDRESRVFEEIRDR